MCITMKITILALCLGLTTANVPSASLAGRSLMQFIMGSRAYSNDNPQRSMTCFDYYIPLLDSLTKEYETSYAACETSAVEAQAALDESTKPDREILEQSASSSCQRLDQCNGNVNSVDYFGCYEAAGSENTKSMYKISADAAVVLDKVREALGTIETNEYRCKNSSERAYVESWGATVEDMNLCLQGKMPVPTSAPETEPTEATTEEVTSISTLETEEPGTTTQEPEPSTTTTAETDVPTTTEEPDVSTTTEAPDVSTTTEAPDVSTTTEEPDTTTTEVPTTTSQPEGSSEESNTEENSTEGNSTEENSTEGNSTEENSTEESNTEENSTEENSTEESNTEESNENSLPEEDLDDRFAKSSGKFRQTLLKKH